MKHLTTLFLSLLATAATAQDFLFSQFYAVPMSVNAAATGHIEAGNQRITTAYRSQWAAAESGEGAYQGAWVSYEYRHCQKRNFWALGGSVQAEWSRFARYEQVQGRLSGAFHYRLSRRGLYATAGIGGGMLQYGAQLGGLRYDNQFVNGRYDPGQGSGEPFSDVNPSQSVPDLNAGAQMYHTQAGWGGGLAFTHLNQPQFSFLGEKNFLGIGAVVHATYTFWLKKSKRSGLVVRGLYVRQSLSGKNSRQWQGLAGCSWRWTGKGGMTFAPGLMLRAAGRAAPVAGGKNRPVALESVVPTVQWGSPKARLGLSHDANLQRLARPSGGRTELTLTWMLGEEDKCVVCNEF